MVQVHAQTPATPGRPDAPAPFVFPFLLIAAVALALALAVAAVGFDGLDRLLPDGAPFIPTFAT